MQKRILPTAILIILLVLVAGSSQRSPAINPASEALSANTQNSPSIIHGDGEADPSSPARSRLPGDDAAEGAATSTPRSNSRTLPDLEEIAAETPPPMWFEGEFNTDFSIHNVSYSEIYRGGPPKDGIPALDDPKFVSVSEADEWLNPQEPVILFQLGEDVRAYPIQILIWHEIVNDVVDGTPVMVTFCPLCNTAIAFDRTLDGEVLDFGTTGRLRGHNLIMYDRQTESWWQQASGEGIVGHYTDRQLTYLPAVIIAWEDFKRVHPNGLALSRETGHRRNYGQNPYPGYDNVEEWPLYLDPDTWEGMLPRDRVLTIDLNGDAVAYPYAVLAEARVVNDLVGGEEIVVFWEPGAVSPLDQVGIEEGREVGAATAFSRVLEGRTLTFSFNGEQILDMETNSVWNFLGQAVEGQLAGSQLTAVISINHFWFSWAIFKPDTRIYTLGDQ